MPRVGKKILVRTSSPDKEHKQVYNSVKEFAEKIGYNPNSITNAMNKGKQVAGKYDISFVSDDYETKNYPIFEEYKKNKVLAEKDIPEFMIGLKAGESVLCTTEISGEGRKEVSIVCFIPKLGFIDDQGKILENVIPVSRTNTIKRLESELVSMMTRKKKLEKDLDFLLENINDKKKELRSLGVS